jgi:hypothetical protein
MVKLPLDLEGPVPPDTVVGQVVDGRKGERVAVAAGVLAKLDSIVLVRVPSHHHHLGRRIPVGREVDRTVTAVEVELRVCPGRRADPFINPVLGVALGTGDIHAALSDWSLGRCP